MAVKPRFAFVVEYVADIESVRAFYTDVFGLEVRRYHPTFVQFDSFAIANDESPTGSREAELYWLVDDADTAFTELSRKADVAMPLTQQPFGKVFAVKDPSGRRRFILELAQDRPSRVVKSPARAGGSPGKTNGRNARLTKAQRPRAARSP